jgi:hypothetical protein
MSRYDMNHECHQFVLADNNTTTITTTTKTNPR